MKVIFEILRQKDPNGSPYWQKIPYQTETPATVATALNELNAQPVLKDLDGNPVDPVRWECSCLQKKCGACAMRINGRLCLACDTMVQPGTMKLEPLIKFPTVADLIVDRSALYENLKAMHVYRESDLQYDTETNETAQKASRCLQCGCCLEICPNYYGGSVFAGAASMVPAARLLSLQENTDLEKAYRKRVYEGCGKSLACHNICPAGIPIEDLLVKSNRKAVWKFRRGKKR